MTRRSSILFTIFVLSLSTGSACKKKDGTTTAGHSETVESQNLMEGYTPHKWSQLSRMTSYHGTYKHIFDDKKGSVFFTAPKWGKESYFSGDNENDLAFIIRSKLGWESENTDKRIVAMTIVPGSSGSGATVILGLLVQYEKR